MRFSNDDPLYKVFTQVVGLHYRRSLKLLSEVGIYHGQPPLLFALSRKNGQSQKELANRLNIKPATITVMVSRMEKTELVERKQDPEDQRVSRVYITEKGKQVFEEVKKAMEVMDTECFNNFTSEEKVLLRRLLMQVRNNLMEVNDEEFHI